MEALADAVSYFADPSVSSYQEHNCSIKAARTCTTAHASQRIAHCVCAHLEMVHDSSTQTWCRVEQAAVGNHKVDLMWPHTSFVQQVLDGGEACCSKLKACCFDAQFVVTARLNGGTHGSLVSQTCAAYHVHPSQFRSMGMKLPQNHCWLQEWSEVVVLIAASCRCVFPLVFVVDSRTCSVCDLLLELNVLLGELPRPSAKITQGCTWKGPTAYKLKAVSAGE